MNKFSLIALNKIDSSVTENRTIPQYTEKLNRGGWINYGQDNLFSDYLIYLMNCSAKHNAVLKDKSLLIGGNGWNKDGLDGIAISFLKNSYNQEDLDEIAYKTSYDLEIYGAFSLEILYNKAKTMISEINYLPTNKIRLSECGKWVYYCKDWSNVRKNTPVKYPVFNKENPTSNQILYVKEYRPGTEYYGQPSYLSAVKWINLEYEISSFYLNQVQKGFMPSKHVNFPWIPETNEMKDDIVRETKRELEGTEAECTLITFSDSDTSKVTIEAIQSNRFDEMFIELNKQVSEGILIGHSFPKVLLSTDNSDKGIFSKNDVIEGLEVFQAKYINRKQLLIQNTFNNLLKFNNSGSKLVLNKYELDVEKMEEGNTNITE